ncbi:MAG: YceI family protein [Bacteroidota bacterium]
MKNTRFLLLLTLLAGAAFVGFRAIMVSEWTVVVEDVTITFEGKGVKGSVSGLEAEIKFSPADLANSKLTASVDANTLDTKSKLQTQHTKSEKWMDAEKYPTITFTSKEIRTTDDGYECVGDLNMHGVTKEITMPFTFAEAENGGTFTGVMTVAREDFNVGGGGKTAAEITVTITVPVTG